MIDLAALRQDPDAFKKSQAARSESVELVDQVITADAARRTALGEFESLRANQKAIGTQVAKAQGDEKQALLAQTKTLSDQVKAAENQLREMDASLDALVLGLSNVVDPAAPVGGEDDFVVFKEVGTKRDFAAEGIAVRDHVEIGELLGAIDIERGAKVSGSRFYYLTGPGAMLELALVQLAMNTAQKNGFTPMIPPALVKPAAMEGTGFLGQAAENVYRLEADDMYLVGTAEVPLAAYHMDEIL
jgi:seryl-tRNA synthetase